MNFLQVLEILNRMEGITKEISIEEKLIFYKRNIIREKEKGSLWQS